MTTRPPPVKDHRPLSERLRPDRIEEVLGDRTAIDRFAEWGRAWARPKNPPTRRAVILSGPPGVGKTTLALALARSHGWTVVEMNASDARNQTAVESVAGRAALTHTLGESGVYRTPAEGGRTLILLDEADSLTGRRTEAGPARRPTLSFRDFLAGRYGTVDALAEAWGLGIEDAPPRFASWGAIPLSPGRSGWTKLAPARRDIAEWQGASRPRDSSDRGGYPAIVRLVRDTRQPIVLTVNDDRELFDHAGALRSLALHIRLVPVAPTEMTRFLESTARAERLRLAPGAIGLIVERAHGDVRAALNDLEAIGPLPKGVLQTSLLATRDTSSELRILTGAILSEPRFYRSTEIRDRVDTDPEELWPWMEENVPRFARSPLAVEKGLDRVAQAQLHIARARRQRVWSLWSYGSEIATGGASLAIASAGGAGPAPVAFPEFLAGMGQSRMRRALRDSILAKSGAAFHLSKRKGSATTLPLLETLVSGRRATRAGGSISVADELVRELDLSEEEVEFLGGSASRVREDPEREPAPETREEVPTDGTVPPSDPAHPVQTRLGQFDR